MASYKPIAQGEHDEFSDQGTDSALMSSPYVPLEFSLTPLSADLSFSPNVLTFPSASAAASSSALQASPTPATSADKWHMTRFGEDDVEDQDATSSWAVEPSLSRMSVIRNSVVPDLGPPQGAVAEYGLKPSPSPEPLVRSNSTVEKHDIRSPKAGLEAMQGAYLGNVKTLEESADAMSQSADLDSEIRRKFDEQKRSDSMLSSSKGLDDTSQVSEAIRRLSISISRKSSTASLAARSRNMSFTSQVLNEHVQHASTVWSEGEMRHSVLSPTSPGRNSLNASFMNSFTSPTQDLNLNLPYTDENRPMTAKSSDTTQQARVLFSDFDGVHGDSAQEAGPRERMRMSTMNNLFARPAQPVLPPNTVFYPAPIPAQLNLPQRISRQAPPSARDIRKSQFMAELNQQNQSRTSFLPEVSELIEEEAKPESPVKGLRTNTPSFGYIHPAARASAFFDKPVQRQEINLQDESAVKTLDSILHASASAPVDAFVDHPFVGHIGSEVYGRDASRKSSAEHEKFDREKNKGKRTTSLLNIGDVLMRRRTKLMEGDSDSSEPEEEESENVNFLPGSGGPLSDEEEEGEEGEPIDPSMDYVGKPTTLLAELQLRKQQQKQRTRTAMTAIPGGMHTTLLEMDAVAQKQKEARKQKPVTLAWEDPALEAEREEDPDEDIPLGLILARNHNTAIAHAGPRMTRDLNIPYGLREQRDYDDNEPLARRRERILTQNGGRAQTMGNLQPPTLDEPEEETLAERIKRLKSQGGTSTMLGNIRPSGDFTDLKSQLGLAVEDAQPAVGVDAVQEQPLPVEDEEEETLAQRKKRLLAEEATRAQQPTYQQQPQLIPMFNSGSASSLLQQQQQEAWQRQSHYSRDFLPQAPVRASTMMGYPTHPQLQARSFSNGLFNTGFGTAAATPGFQLPQVRNGLPMMNMNMGMNMGMGMAMPPPMHMAPSMNVAPQMMPQIMPNMNMNPTLNSSNVWAVEGVVPEARKLERVEKWRSEIVP